MASKNSSYQKNDKVVVHTDDKGKFSAVTPAPKHMEKVVANTANVVASIEEEDTRDVKEIRKDLRVLNKEAEFAGKVLDLTLDTALVLQDRIDTLDDELLTARLKADSENRPLTDEEIARAKEIREEINELRSRRKTLIEHTKDARLVKAEADVKAHEDELALEMVQGKKLVLDYEGEELGDAVVTGEFEANSPEWHEQRKNVIGGSDVSVIMGTSVFSTENKLLATKLGLVDASFEKTIATSLGDMYEPIIQREFAKRHAKGNSDGNDVFTVYHTKASWRNKDNPTHGANVDGLFDSSGKGGAPDSILEIKAVSDASKWEDGAPIYYRQQVLWYMHVTGFRKGKVAVLINQNEYREYDIIPQEGEIEDLVSKVNAFEDKLSKEQKKLSKMNLL